MRVLIVDDNEMNRVVIKSMLDAVEVETAEAELAKTALSMIEVNDFDLVLMDLRMPGMDGIEAIREIRARGDHKAGLPVVVLTADNAQDIRNTALAAGADDLLSKPVQMQALFDAMAVAINRLDQQGAMLA